MIVDAQKRFSSCSTGAWFQKIISGNTRQSCDVVVLSAEPVISIEQILTKPPVVLSETEEMQLRESVPLLLTNFPEIAEFFYKKVVRLMWWNHDGFKRLVTDESERLVRALVGHAQNPSESALLAFFLADTWIKYRYKGDLGESYDAVVRYLAEAVVEALWKQLSPGAMEAWKKTLDPGHIFDTGLSFGASRLGGNPDLNSNL